MTDLQTYKMNNYGSTDCNGKGGLGISNMCRINTNSHKYATSAQ